MPDVVLATLNAKFIHASFGLRYLLANLGELRPRFVQILPFALLGGVGGICVASHVAGEPLRRAHRRRFVYSDMWVDDARLVVLNAMDARERGARIETRTRLIDARRDGEGWTATVEADGQSHTVQSRVLVNAAGPWVADVIGRTHGARRCPDRR